MATALTTGAETVTLEVAVLTQLVLPKLVVAVSVYVVVPFGSPLAVVFTLVGAAILVAGLEDQRTEVVAFNVIGVVKLFATGTWKMDAEAAEQELSLMAEEIEPEL